MATTQEAVLVQRRRFSADEFERMAEIGILREDDRVELIEGDVVRMSAVGRRHVACVTELPFLTGRRLGDEFRVSVQSPIRLGEYGEPEPDVAVLHARDYNRALPGPEDGLLLIEVADTSLDYDRSVKLPLYARAGIPEAVLVDLNAAAFGRHTEPSADGYCRVVRFGHGDVFRSAVLPSLELAVADVLGR